ncbi:MAG: MOSC domain-containing protein [Spirochaetales bacterium]|nr:MOSC domain-containing protein [Spirochaetales bacterium]
MFKILSLNISEKKGEQKIPIKIAELKVDHGILGDAHAGNWHRQISLLANEDIESMRGNGIDLDYGDFAENITTEGIVLHELPIGTRLNIDSTVLEITQIGKECHHGCAIYAAVGDCVMPRRGVFAKVIEQGEISNESSCYYNI